VKKLKLDIESVRVESFEMGENANRGTVVAHISAAVSCYDTDCCTPNPGCPTYQDTDPCACSGNWTCPGGFSCNGGSTCYQTCHTGQCICI
jgi:hypothetical protein